MKTSIHRTTTTLCTLNILHRLRGEDKYRRLRSVGASLFRRPVSQGHLSFFFHLSPPFFSTSCTRPLSFITFLVFLSLLLLLLLLLFAVFRHSRFFAKKKRKGTTSLFIERWNTVIIRSRGWTVTFSGATTRVKSVLLFRPSRDRFFDGGRVTWKSSIERGECIIRMVKLCLPPARGDLQLIVYA